MKNDNKEIVNARDLRYDVCYKKVDGKEVTISRGVTIKKGLTSIVRYRKLRQNMAPAVNDILYIYLVPLFDMASDSKT